MSSQLVKLVEENEQLFIEFDNTPLCDAILQSETNKLNHDYFVIYQKINIKQLIKRKNN